PSRLLTARCSRWSDLSRQTLGFADRLSLWSTFFLVDPRRDHAARSRALAAAGHAGPAVLGLDHLELDAPVLVPRGGRVRLVERAVLAVALRHQAPGGDAARLERLHHRRGARARQAQVVLVARTLVGVPGDLDHAELRVALQGRRNRVQDGLRLRQDLGAAGRELDLVQDHQVVPFDDHAAFVRAPVFVVRTVVGLRLVRALIAAVRDLIAIVVGLRAAVFVFEAVEILGIERALIVLVEDAVLVVVGLRTPIVIFEAVAVFGDVGALVAGVEDAVPVAVALFTLWAAVLVLVAVEILGDVGAAIIDVEDAVVVVVRIGAPVLVLEPVEVLRLVGALVDVVLVAVAVPISDGWLEHEAEDQTQIGRFETRGPGAAAAAHHQIAVALDEQLDAADHLLAH